MYIFIHVYLDVSIIEMLQFSYRRLVKVMPVPVQKRRPMHTPGGRLAAPLLWLLTLHPKTQTFWKGPELEHDPPDTRLVAVCPVGLTAGCQLADHLCRKRWPAKGAVQMGSHLQPPAWTNDSWMVWHQVTSPGDITYNQKTPGSLWLPYGFMPGFHDRSVLVVATAAYDESTYDRESTKKARRLAFGKRL